MEQSFEAPLYQEGVADTVAQAHVDSARLHKNAADVVGIFALGGWITSAASVAAQFVAPEQAESIQDTLYTVTTVAGFVGLVATVTYAALRHQAALHSLDAKRVLDTPPNSTN